MQSNGGVIGPEDARRNGVRCILSGPAGGVIGSQYVASQNLSAAENNLNSNEEPDTSIRVITFDMGGTSTDVSLIDGVPRLTSEAEIGGCPIKVPLLDIHTIGAGGGSIALVDAGGALRVGPQSAGADPGPACYGRGDLPTVTDANLVLGRLVADRFLGGLMPLNTGRAHQALEGLGIRLKMDAVQAALGVVEVVNAHMERALRVISVERGHDPRRFDLLSFGGAGGLHAAQLGRGLGIPRVIIPPLASTLSAFGMLTADMVKDYTLTVMIPGETSWEEVEKLLEPLVRRGRVDIRAEGVEDAAIRTESTVQMRYRGQSYELTVPFSKNFAADFHKRHQQTYSYARLDAPLELVNLHVRAIGKVQKPILRGSGFNSPDPTLALIGNKKVVFSQGAREVPLYQAELLRPGNQIQGPGLVVRSDTTILIPPSDWAEIDAYNNILINL